MRTTLTRRRLPDGRFCYSPDYRKARASWREALVLTAQALLLVAAGGALQTFFYHWGMA